MSDATSWPAAYSGIGAMIAPRTGNAQAARAGFLAVFPLLVVTAPRPGACSRRCRRAPRAPARRTLRRGFAARAARGVELDAHLAAFAARRLMARFW